MTQNVAQKYFIKCKYFFFSVVAAGPYSFCSRASALLFCADCMVRYNETFSVQYGLEFLINFKAQMDCSVFTVRSMINGNAFREFRNALFI